MAYADDDKDKEGSEVAEGSLGEMMDEDEEESAPEGVDEDEKAWE